MALSKLLRPIAVAGLCTAAGLVSPGVAEACTCEEPHDTLESAYADATDTMIVEVLAAQIWHTWNEFFKVRVLETFSGCLQRDDVVFLETRALAGECGEDLVVGRRYLVTSYATTVDNLFTITQCGYNRKVIELTDAEKDFLRNLEPPVCEVP